MPRTQRTLSTDWWWSVDRWLLFGLLALILTGLVLLMGGGPPVAERLGYHTFHFVQRQVMFLIPALILMIGLSFLTPRSVRRAALLLFIISLAAVIATLFIGVEIKGARRWLNIWKLGIQPSEFLKPAFIILIAWAFSEGARRRDVPGVTLGVLLYPLTVIPLVLQPDVGQTILITCVWLGVLVVAGIHWFWFAGAIGSAAVGGVILYETLPHVQARVERFLDKSSGDSFQTDTALEAFAQGGWFGKGPGEGTVKHILPDAHTDFIFAVTAEEFGVVMCLFVVCLYAFLVLRGLRIARHCEDLFRRLAITGLVLIFGIQALINMMVNVNLIPAKGMTLPFISYGGSSLISLAVTMGFLLALTRRRPQAETLEQHPNWVSLKDPQTVR
jgi:cell division protein FtsW